jgi:asparagine synthase (glutamine-hydrolysing)
MRLLPEDVFDNQPLCGGGGRFILIADVRLDNRDDLANALLIPAGKARLLCDAAILLAAIERWGEGCIERLIGDYAFVLWDCEKRCFLLARDPSGGRPLHYHRGNGFFAVASMPKGLHALSQVPYEPDEERIAFLFLLPDFGSRSLFRGIERVEPGHVVTVTASGYTVRQHWQPSRGPLKLRRWEEYAEALRTLLDQAVKCRLRGVENVGAHLSGGLDSSAVAATAARLLAPSSQRVIAFTAVPREGYAGPNRPGFIIDEGSHAAATAAMYPNMEHVLVRSPGRSPLDDLDSNFLLCERPITNICNYNIWIHSINDAARERNLSVMLTGDAGNLGLSYVGLELLPELFRNGKWLAWWQASRALVTSGYLRWRGVVTRTLGPWTPAEIWMWLCRVGRGDNFDVAYSFAINPDRLAEVDLDARLRGYGEDPARRPAKNAFSVRLKFLLESDWRGNTTKATLGGWQIDLRNPLLDVRLLEFCLAVPTEQFLCNGITKALARRALSDRVPKLVLDETRRGLQAADWHERLTAVRDRVAAELHRLDACPAAARALDLPRLYRLVENWPSDWQSDETTRSYRFVLLRAISIGHFLLRASRVNQAS